jgi:hypothetical protein
MAEVMALINLVADRSPSAILPKVTLMSTPLGGLRSTGTIVRRLPMSEDSAGLSKRAVHALHEM